MFSKINLQSSYHHLRIKVKDISRMTFKSIHGQYEFLVIPFGLTNTPTVFMDLMNQVFKPVLNKYVRVFIDDILVYSKSLAKHVVHITHVIENSLAEQIVCQML